ncbi:MAG: tetratricopeptide repeat protein [Candidatus Korobacteraceae bacterium]
MACLFVAWAKWPFAIGSAIYLFIYRQFVPGLIALFWPFLAGLIPPPGKIGVIELAFAKKIGYVPENGGVPQDDTPQDADRAEAWFKEGKELWRQRRHVEAAACFKPVAEQGHAAAQDALGSMYAWGYGVPRDWTQAAAWWRKAAEQGNAEAQGNFGMAYAAGMGVPQDYAQVALWWRRASEQGDAYAQGELGYLYALGKGVPRDYAEAILWLRKAAEQGLPNAQHNLGVLYRDGYGVPQDHAEAYFWFAVAAGAGELGTPSAKDVAKDRDEVASHLTPADLSREQERAQRWLEAHQAKPQ